MLKPATTSGLASVQAWSNEAIPAVEPAMWNPLTPVEELPQALSRLRDAQQHLNRLVQDAEAQVVHFLRRGPLVAHTGEVKLLIERFYSFSTAALRASHELLSPGITNENIHVATSNVDYSFWNGFTIDWKFISGYRAVPLAALEKNGTNWQWNMLAANPLIDWQPKSIKRHFRHLADSFAGLSKNTGINWTPDLLRAFAPHWDYSSDGLLGNDALPWEDESLLELLLQITPEGDLDEDELREAGAEMRERVWERNSSNRHRLWMTEELRQHTEELNWSRLSANPALPFSTALLSEFEAYWDWEELAANPGFFEKLLKPLLSDTVVHEFLLLSAS